MTVNNSINIFHQNMILQGSCSNKIMKLKMICTERVRDDSLWCRGDHKGGCNFKLLMVTPGLSLWITFNVDSGWRFLYWHSLLSSLRSTYMDTGYGIHDSDMMARIQGHGKSLENRMRGDSFVIHQFLCMHNFIYNKNRRIHVLLVVQKMR